MIADQEQLDNVLKDPERLKALAKTFLLDSPPEVAFDRITDLVRRLLNAPLSLVSLVAEDHQFFKSAQGLPESISDLRTTPLSHSFCKHTVALNQPLVVKDTRIDDVVKEVQSINDFGIHTYIGVPLRTPDNQTLGTLCALGFEPRAWNEAELDTLNHLSEVVMTEIALRLEVETQKSLQQQLKVSEHRYRSVINEIHDAVIRIDLDSKITFVNPAWEGLLGFTTEATIGRSINDFLDRDPVYGSPFQALMAHASSGKVYTTHVHSHDGSMKWFEFRMNLNEEARPARLIGMLTDVTSNYRIEAEKEARERAERHLKLKNALLSNMTHEFRTPLAAIMSCSDILEEEVSSDQQPYVSMIKQGGERLLTTMDSILLYAQAESGNLTPRPSSFNLVDVVHEIVGTSSTPSIPIHIEAPGEACISTDQVLCTNILRCILDNAIKFSNKGPIIITITPLQNSIQVEIADSGIGISEENLTHIFTPFDQVSDGYARIHEGVGLGLPLTKILVDLLNGSLYIESMVGQGTTVLIELPVSG